MTVPTFFEGELQLAGWSESHTAGCKVTFWLPSPDQLDVFRALTVRKGNQAGQRFMCVLVELGDDEKPVEQTPSAQPESKGGPLAQLAGRWCNDPLFWKFLEDKCACINIDSTTRAAAALRTIVGCSSRAEIDHDVEAATRFQTLVRVPYMQWLHEQHR